MRALKGISMEAILHWRGMRVSDLRNCSPELKMYCRSSLILDRVEEAIDG